MHFAGLAVGSPLAVGWHARAAESLVGFASSLAAAAPPGGPLMAMRWLRVSLFAQAILAAYFQVIQWLPLGRWNYQPGFTPLGVEAIRGRATVQDVLVMVAFVVPFGAFWVAYSKGLRWLMWICTFGYAIWLALQVKTWWVAYVFGASESWARVYDRVFRHATQLLPSSGRHLPPDGMHLVLHVLLAAVVVPAVVGLLKPPISRPHVHSQSDAA